MNRDYVEFQERSEPLGYFITFRCYGTWLHGDERGSVGRRITNLYGGPKIQPNSTLREAEAAMMKTPPFELGIRERSVVTEAIREVCRFRRYSLFALNVRTNHSHVVTGNGGKVERIMNDFKVYSTRALRAANLVEPDRKLWSRHGSTRYLWTEQHIALAVDYVSNGQGGELPSFD